MDELVLVVLDALIGGVVLWLAAKITSVDLVLREAVIAAGGAAIVALVPTVGWALSIVVLFVLLKKFSRANIWPDLILMVIVSRLVSFLAFMALGGV
ncbi:MAG TPA: hypothetical protein IAA18_01565 [Candidatus Pseudomonas excrementavium]|uniref:Uncharacterized protein n=1 Tax=Halopseudomonas bauzanensis TaxID=653930 RepID=A0A1H9UJH4_9GAMM|nr:hypothetical protein [Halopseudomonas bauzanensis]SES09596.1 hypothetical protein SAMN05216589_2259 [Halopseudomonas bauzanensis]SFM09112.1 hypothetical protein SAMN04487855_2258 [Halopseudomonas bauzanensis]HIZ49750.1 hypothetical protein [Candidatus Pseudomonas excrementavium]